MLILTTRQLSYSNGVYFYSFYVGNSNSTVEVSDTLYVLRDCEIFLQGIKQAAKVKFWMVYGRQFQCGAPFCWHGWNEKSTNQPCTVTHPYSGDSSSVLRSLLGSSIIKLLSVTTDKETDESNYYIIIRPNCMWPSTWFHKIHFQVVLKI